MSQEDGSSRAGSGEKTRRAQDKEMTLYCSCRGTGLWQRWGVIGRESNPHISKMADRADWCMTNRAGSAVYGLGTEMGTGHQHKEENA